MEEDSSLHSVYYLFQKILQTCPNDEKILLLAGVVKDKIFLFEHSSKEDNIKSKTIPEYYIGKERSIIRYLGRG